MAPGTTPKGKNNVQTSTITLNPSLKLPLPIFGQKPKDKTENSKEKKDTEEDSQESGRKSRNRCFNSHCTISKVNYKYYNLQHLKGVFKKHIKTCKQCNLSIQNYLKENNLKFPPTNTCQICCGLNMKKWLKFYSNGDRELWVCNVCEKKQEPSLLSKLFFCQTNIPRQIAVNLTPQPTPFPKKRKSLNDSSNSINKYEEEEEEEEINYANNRSQSRGGKKNEILSPPPKRKATASPSPTLLPPQKRLKTKRKSEEPIYSINNNNNTSNIVNNSPSTPTSNPSIDNISAFSLSTPKDSSDRVLFNNHRLIYYSLISTPH